MKVPTISRVLAAVTIMLVTALAACGHVLFTAALGFLVAWCSIQLSDKIGGWFPWIAGGALLAFGAPEDDLWFGRNPSDPEVLVELAASVGLDADRARSILASDEYAAEVRAREQLYLRNGINAVPAVILNDEYLIQGGQPVEAFERALAQVVAGK